MPQEIEGSGAVLGEGSGMGAPMCSHPAKPKPKLHLVSYSFTTAPDCSQLRRIWLRRANLWQTAGSWGFKTAWQGVAWDNLTSPCPAFSPFCSGPTARAPWTRRGTKHNVPSVPGFPPMGSFTPRYVVPFGHDLAFKHSDEAVTVPRDSSDHLTIMDLSSSTSWSSSANSLKDSAVKKRRG